MKKWIFLAVAAFVFGTWLVAKSRDEQPIHTNSTASEQPGSALPAAVQAQAAILDRYRQEVTEALKKATNGDEYGEKIFAYFEEHACFSLLEQGGVTTMVDKNEARMMRCAQEQKHVEITVASMEERRAKGFPADSCFAFFGERRNIVVPPPETFTTGYFGAALASQLSHAYRITPPNLSPQDDTFLEDEIVGYDLELRLIDHLVFGGYRSSALKFLADNTITRSQAEDLLARNFFSQTKSDDEQAVRLGIATVALDFYQVEANHPRAAWATQKRALIRDRYQALPHQ